MPELYKIIFKDSSVYLGGQSLYKSLWSDIPDKEIKRLEYRLTDGSFLGLEGFEEYSCFVEVTKKMYGPKGTKLGDKLENIYIMGLKKGIVTSYRISLKGERGQTKYIQGDMTRREYKLGEEFRGQPTRDWKKGIK